MADPRQRDMMAAQAPLAGTKKPTEVVDLLSEALGAGLQRVQIDGRWWVVLPECPGCMSYRWDKERERFFHDRDCERAVR